MQMTLSIGATGVRLLTVAQRQVKRWTSAPLAPGLVREGLITDPQAVAAVINELFSSLKAHRQRVAVSVTGLPFTHRILSLPQVSANLLAEAVLRSAKQEIPLPLDELYLSWRVVARRDDGLDVFVLGASRNPVDAVAETLKQAGIKRAVLDLKPLALARAANQSSALIVALEPESFDVILVANGIPEVMRSITPRSLEATIDDNIRRLTLEVARTVQSHNNVHPESAISQNTPLLLTGKLSAEAAASQLLQAEAGRPVELLAPPLSVQGEFSQAEYVTNIGLALKGTPTKPPSTASGGFHDIDIDLLSTRSRANHTPVQLRRIIVPALIVAGIGLLFPLFQFWTEATAETGRLQDQLSQTRQELLLTQIGDTRAEDRETTIDEMLASAEALRQTHQYILAEDDGIARAMSLAVAALPPEARFTSLVADPDRITIRGETDLPASVVTYASALDTAGAFSDVRIAEINEETSSDQTKTSWISFVIVVTR